MPDGLNIEVRGADNLSRTARAAATAFQNLIDANRAAARAVATRAAPPRRTGQLAASVGVLDANVREGVVGSALVYAPVIEFGWPAHGIEAQGFLADAADAAWTEVQDLYADNADRILADVKGV